MLAVIFRGSYKFEKGISDADTKTFKSKMASAVARWDNSGVYLKTDHACAVHKKIKFDFVFIEDDKGPHKTIDVDKKERREWVGMDLNVWIGTTVSTLTHELGHVYGNYDEYKGSGIGGWFERRMWWHDNDYLDQSCAVMHSGHEYPARNFDHFERFVNKHFKPLGIAYRAVRDKPISCE